MPKRDLQANLAIHSGIDIAVTTGDVGTVVWSPTIIDTKVATGRWAVAFSPSLALDSSDDLRYKFQGGDTDTGPWVDPPDEGYLPTWNHANNNIIEPEPVTPYLPTASCIFDGQYVRLGIDVVSLVADRTITVSFIMYSDFMPFNGWSPDPHPSDGLP